MSGPKFAHATLKRPRVMKEIVIGIVLGLTAGMFYEMHLRNEQRKVRAYYDLLDRGEISVVVDKE